MAIQTTLATRFWVKTVIMAVVCIVLGVWGIWDYVVAIPRATMQANRAALLSDVIQPALSTELGSQEREDASIVLRSLIQDQNSDDTKWKSSLEVFNGALGGGGMELQKEAGALLESEFAVYGNVTPPSKFDRPMQWVFMLCIPFGFYYLWKYFQMKGRAKKYSLDDNGTLTTPEGVWESAEIQDIDMSRWIAKTGNARSTWTAKAVVRDGQKILLDDYVYNDMHLIIGAIAHRFYPEEWTPLARRVRTETDTETEEE